MTRRVENPKQRCAEILYPARSSALQSFEDRRKILLPVETDSDGNIHFRMQHILLLESLHQPVRRDLIVFRAAKVSAHFLECHQETGKIAVPIKWRSVRQRCTFTVFSAEFHQRCRLYCSLQV